MLILYCVSMQYMRVCAKTIDPFLLLHVFIFVKFKNVKFKVPDCISVQCKYIVVDVAVMVILNAWLFKQPAHVFVSVHCHHSRSHIGSAWLHWPLFKHCCTGSPTR